MGVGSADFSIWVIEGVGIGVGDGVGFANFSIWVEGVGKGVGVSVGVGVGVAGFLIWVEGVGKGVDVGVVSVGFGVGIGVGEVWGVGVWARGCVVGVVAFFRLLLGLQRFLLWPCCLAGLSVGIVVGD